MSDNLRRALNREGAVEPTALRGMRSVGALCQRDILMYDYEGMDRLTRQHQVETQPVAWGVNEDGHRYGVAQPRGSSRHARRLVLAFLVIPAEGPPRIDLSSGAADSFDGFNRLSTAGADRGMLLGATDCQFCLHEEIYR